MKEETVGWIDGWMDGKEGAKAGLSNAYCSKEWSLFDKNSVMLPFNNACHIN